MVRVVSGSKSSLALSLLPEVTWRQHSIAVAIDLSCLLKAHRTYGGRLGRQDSAPGRAGQIARLGQLDSPPGPWV